MKTIIERENNEDLTDFKNNNDKATSLKTENLHLEFMLQKYNYVLKQYQIKYGSEIFDELDNQLDPESVDPINKKAFVDAISIIKEYERNFVELNNEVQEKNEAINHLSDTNKKLLEDNDMLNEQLEIALK